MDFLDYFEPMFKSLDTKNGTRTLYESPNRPRNSLAEPKKSPDKDHLKTLKTLLPKHTS